MVDSRKSTEIEESGDERRKHRRIEAPLKARFMNEAGEEQPALIINISAGGALLKAKQPPAFGEIVVIYVDRVGRFDGRVIRSSESSFAVTYEQKRRRNAKTADSLTELVNLGTRANDRRNTPRLKQDAPAKVFFEDGRTKDCAILDISLTGASIEISPRPPLGARLILGRMNAKVVRRHETGVGIVFTGTAERTSDVIDSAATPVASVDIGPRVAKPFGKKSQ